ncbi:cytochrome C oxidase subunit IV family protein [Microvirga sp. 2MCAF38]|uniref:cytochrome C oxidase subunit IV family protein n=1 Tax=Microvirga sp. 2MCAF38 TaxID=3232989 RepID=UPI003F9C46DA
MSGQPERIGIREIWRRNLAIWLALLVLLAATLLTAHVNLGAFNVAAALGIAALKSLAVALLFMGLNRSVTLVRLTAATGFLWLVILFTLTLSDFLTRSS